MKRENQRVGGGTGPAVRSAALAALALFAAGPAAAHPHAWIDLRVEVQFDAEGAVTALRQTWLFDPYYTAFTVEGMDGDGDGRPDAEALRALLQENLSNLDEYRYFTEAFDGQAAVAFGAPEGAVSGMRGQRLEMSFVLPLAEPVSATGAGFRYRIYDPTYYIEMLHAEDGPAIRLHEAPDACGFRIEGPDPDPEAVSLAASADSSQRTVPGGEGIGALFAETVVVSCE